MASKPVLAITMGDPAGVGPEIIVKALGEGRIYDICLPVVVGDAAVMEHAAVRIVGSPLRINSVRVPAEATGVSGTIDVLSLAGLDLTDFVPGRLDARCGEAAFLAVRTAIELALKHEIDGTVTAPLNKEALHLAGHQYDGHTEIYAT